VRSKVLISMIILPLFGCHAKFKKAAPHIDTVNVQVVTTGGPQVQLGKIHDEDAGLVGLIVNVTQTIKEVHQTRRVAEAVSITNQERAMTEGVQQVLKNGPPFAYTEAEDAAATLQLEVLSYGLMVPHIGAPGHFTYTVRARIYQADGERVYRKRLTCTAGVGDPSVPAIVLGTVNNVKQLKEMTDPQIDATFAEIARYCGGKFVLKMRKHAG
jgi:hypothetical protein